MEEMNITEEKFKEIIINFANKHDIMLLKEHIDYFYKYMNILMEWNNKMNLTAITKPREIIEKHFIDSLTILKYIKDKKSMIDIGTGAGFPGIPVKIVNDNIKITLLDSLNKRINFLNYLIENLNLINIITVHGRAETYISKNREKFDVAVSRAVANMSTLVEYLLPYVKVNGLAICMKGANIKDEIEKSSKAIEILGGKIDKIDNFLLGNENERNVIIIRKIKPTPKQFPRKAGIPSKEPIIK